jgi:hypothetical protein
MQASNAHVAAEQRAEVGPESENARQFDDVLSRYLPAFQRIAFRNVWSAAELQAEDELGSWSAPMYSAFGGVKDSWP